MSINLHATATIDVQAQHFQQFVQGFNQFQRNLNQVPGQWQNINRHASMAYVHMQRATAAMVQNVNAAHTRLGTFNAALQRTSYALHQKIVQPMQNALGRMTSAGGGGTPTSSTEGGAPARAQNNQGPPAGSGSASGGGRGRGGGGAPPNLRGTFGRGAFAMRGGPMLPFGLGRFNVGGLLAGLAGSGALYGMGSLAEGAANTRMFYTGIGSNYGDTKAFGLSDRFFNGKEFLAAMGSARNMPTSDAAQALLALGIDPHNKDPGSLGTEALRKLRSEYKGKDPFTLGTEWSGRKLGGIISREGLERIAGASDSEFDEQFMKLVRDQEAMKIPDGTVKAWHDLNQQLKTSAEVITRDLLVALGVLAPAITQLSATMTNFFTSMMNNPIVKKFIEGTSKEISGMSNFLDALMQGKGMEYIQNLRRKNGATPNDPVDRILGAAGGMFSDKFNADKGEFRKVTPEAGGSSFGGFFSRIFSALGGAIGSDIYSGASSGTSWFNRNVIAPIMNFSMGNKGNALSLATPNLAQSDANILNTLMGLEANPALGYDSIGKEVKYRDGSVDKAYGMYQVMGNNIRSWTKRWIGREMSPTEFLQNPKAQDAVALGQFKAYMEQYGNPVDAMAAWKSGQPYAVSQNWEDKAAGDTVRQYVAKGVGIWNSQPGAAKVDLTIYNQTGSGVSANVGTTAVPPALIINNF